MAVVGVGVVVVVVVVVGVGLESMDVGADDESIDDVGGGVALAADVWVVVTGAKLVGVCGA